MIGRLDLSGRRWEDETQNKKKIYEKFSWKCVLATENHVWDGGEVCDTMDDTWHVVIIFGDWFLFFVVITELSRPDPWLQYWRIKFVVTFLSRFLDSRVGPINFRYSLSCGPGSQDSKLVLNFSVALFLLISWPF